MTFPAQPISALAVPVEVPFHCTNTACPAFLETFTVEAEAVGADLGKIDAEQTTCIECGHECETDF